MLNTISSRTLARILMDRPEMPVAVLSPDAGQVCALWEEHLYTQVLALWGKDGSECPAWSGDVLLLDFAGPPLGVVDA